jgi:hypothetical protein
MDLVNEIKRELFFATFFVDVNSKDRPMFTHGSASESSTECVSEKWLKLCPLWNRSRVRGDRFTVALPDTHLLFYVLVTFIFIRFWICGFIWQLVHTY